MREFKERGYCSGVVTSFPACSQSLWLEWLRVLFPLLNSLFYLGLAEFNAIYEEGKDRSDLNMCNLLFPAKKLCRIKALLFFIKQE